MNGVCVSPTSIWQGFGSPVRGIRQTDPVRRSKSQGTSRNKLQKCLSSISYSDEGLLPARNLERVNLLTSRQYCSFGSTVTYQIFTTTEFFFFLIMRKRCYVKTPIDHCHVLIDEYIPFS